MTPRRTPTETDGMKAGFSEFSEPINEGARVRFSDISDILTRVSRRPLKKAPSENEGDALAIFVKILGSNWGQVIKNIIKTARI